MAVGNFNPAIFTPDWFELNQLIGSSDANAAREKASKNAMLVTQQLATFETPWFVLQVLENQFSLTSKEALTPAFRDLAVGTFQLVPHTPITGVGLNFMAHYRLESENDYHKIGDRLAPKELWNGFYAESAAGMAALSIRIQPGSRNSPVKTGDFKQITVQPSKTVRCGVFFASNDHHEIQKGTIDSRPARMAASIIDEKWEESWHDAERVFQGVLDTILKHEER